MSVEVVDVNENVEPPRFVDANNQQVLVLSAKVEGESEDFPDILFVSSLAFHRRY